jgi:O-acetyl-ADP-ribose deacetylase (regulator of RNase III)
MNRIKIIKTDITTLEIDAIVNAANRSLLGGGGVDGAIHQAAGPELLEACRKLKGCETGEAKVTEGFKLPAKWVIHTVGPIWSNGLKDEAALLVKCYIECMKLAKEYRLKSIAFPAISCGVYRFPVSQAARIAISTLSEVLKNNKQLELVYLSCFSDEVFEAYEEALGRCKSE